MKDNWKEKISCVTQCPRCSQKLKIEDPRILSVYDHQAICMKCKKKEEEQPDYKEVSSRMIGQCMAETELLYGDPEAYCFHHFYPYKCSS